jgi:hypothetical protein
MKDSFARKRLIGIAIGIALAFLAGALLMRTLAAKADPTADSMTFTPPNPQVGETFTVTVSSSSAYVWVNLDSVPTASISWVGAGGSGPYYWRWNAVVGAAGTYTFTFYTNCVPGPCTPGVQNSVHVQTGDGMTFTPSSPALNQAFGIRVTSPTPYAWVELGVNRWQDTLHCPGGSNCHAWSGSGQEAPDAVGGSYFWDWGAKVAAPGTYTFTFYHDCPPGPGCTPAAQRSLTAPQVFGIGLSPDRAGSVHPNTVAIYTHTLVNTGNYTDTFALAKSSSQGWTVSVSPPGTIALPAGGSSAVVVSVTVPAGTLSGAVDTVVVTATSQLSATSRASVSDTTTVGQVPGVALAPDRSGTADPATPITYTHALTNTGNGPDTFTLLGVSSQGWTVALSPASTPLAAGGSRTVVVSVTVPSAISGTVDTTTITATSQSDAAVRASVAGVTTVRLAGTLDFSPGRATTPRPGEAVIYTHTLSNAVNYTQTVTLRAVSAAGFTTAVGSSIILPAAATVAVAVTVQVPPAASTGLTDTVTITATGSLLGQAVVADTLTVRTGAVYLPLVVRNWPPLHEVADAPDACPGMAMELDHFYRDDLDRANDNDWYSFTATAGAAYTLQTRDLEASADTVLALFAPDCSTELAENDDAAPGDRASRIEWTAPAGGVYCVDVRGYDWRVYGANTHYTLAVTGGGR